MPASATALWPVVHLSRLLYVEASRLHAETPCTASRVRLERTRTALAEAEAALARARRAG